MSMFPGTFEKCDARLDTDVSLYQDSAMKRLINWILDRLQPYRHADRFAAARDRMRKS